MNPRRKNLPMSISLLFCAMFQVSACTPNIPPETCLSPTVYDGDTIRCSNYTSNIRISPSSDEPSYWFDAPELMPHLAECSSELTLARQSEQALTSLIDNSFYIELQAPMSPHDVDFFGRNVREVIVVTPQKTRINVAHHLTSLSLGQIYHKREQSNITWCSTPYELPNLNNE